MATHAVDTLYQNATVIDGGGNERYIADVAVKDDRIHVVGDGTGVDSARCVAAAGLVLTPGFIDVHTHDDVALIKHPEMTAKASQGVTTVITGNCGVSLAPMTPQQLVPPFDLIAEPDDFAYPQFRDYAKRLADAPPALNAAMLVGHSTLRLEAMDTLERPASRGEIAQMCKRLSSALEDGAMGLSTGLAYPTAIAAPTTEVIELAAVLADYGGVYTSHMRDEEDHLLDAVEETLHIGRSAQVPVVISHHKACGRRNWGKTRESLAMIEAARQSQQVELDVYPYTASSTVLLAQFVERSERVTITWSRALPECVGKDLDDLAKNWGLDRNEAIEKLQPAGAIYHQMDDDDLHRVLRYAPSMIGSDGLPNDERPHPRLWGTFPRVLGHYCRELGLLSLEQAIHKMTGKPAAVFGLTGRGAIAPDAFADLVLFDPDTIIDTADYDNPTQPATGIVEVMVNGSVVYDSQGVSGNRPGRFLTR